MNALRSWGILSARLARYFAYHWGIVDACPPFDDIYRTATAPFYHIWRFDKYVRIRGADRLPDPPVLFVPNHMRLDDPVVMYLAIERATRKAYYARFMMRKGAFDSSPILRSRLINLEELLTLAAAIEIDRDRITWSQLKPFVQRLQEPNACTMYIGRTRSRTGAFMEYLEFDEPGSASWLMAQAQRKAPDKPVAAVPMARSFNPVTKESCISFGEARYLRQDAGREAQRQFDYDVIEAMGKLLEIHGGHVVSALIYLQCLHDLGDGVPVNTLHTRAQRVVAALKDRLHVHPRLLEDVGGEVDRSLAFLEKKVFLTRFRGDIVLAHDRVLGCPPPTRRYIKYNPVKFMVNQTLHLRDFVDAANSAVLG